MYFPKLKKLKDFRHSELVNIDKFLAQVFEKKLTRFSPLLLTKESTMPFEQSIEILLKCSQIGVLKINYEIECTHCGNSDRVVDKLEKIPLEEVHCRVCDEFYTPDPKLVWITFDLIKKPKAKKKEIIPSKKIPPVQNISLEKICHSHYFSEKFVPKELFKIDLEEYKSILVAVKEAVTADEKKKTLENLSEYVFNSTTIFEIVDADRRTNTAEIDRIASIKAIPATFVQEWGSYLIIECKNWEIPVGSKEISRLGDNIDKAGCKVGVLFSKKGVTGRSNNDRDAVREIRSQYERYRRIIIVFSEKDLNEIAEGKNFLTMMEKKYRDLRFLP